MPPAGARRTAPRAQRADARRNTAAILDAATDCLARDPGMSIADIAAAAGVGRITLYGHFKTRAELVDAVLVRTIKHANAILDATDTVHDPILRRVQSPSQRGTHKDARPGAPHSSPAASPGGLRPAIATGSAGVPADDQLIRQLEGGLRRARQPNAVATARGAASRTAGLAPRRC